MWDDEVDVVCVGGTIGGLASALAAVDAGAQVYVATTDLGYRQPPPVSAEPVVIPARSHPARGWLSLPPGDDEIGDFFAALSDDLAPLDSVAGDADLPTRIVRHLTEEERNAHWVEPFFGRRMRTWATECLRSPYGLLHSRVADWPTTTMRTSQGRVIEVTSLGTVASSDDAPITLRGWLMDQADERYIGIQSDAALQRLVFEDGTVIGAVIGTPDGVHAVRARHGVTIAPGDADAAAAGDRTLRGYDRYTELCLVTEEASRFARLELVNTSGTVPQRAVTCPSVNRELHHGVPDGGNFGLRSGRGRQLDRYPPLGQ